MLIAIAIVVLIDVSLTQLCSSDKYFKMSILSAVIVDRPLQHILSSDASVNTWFSVLSLVLKYFLSMLQKLEIFLSKVKILRLQPVKFFGPNDVHS